MILLRSYILAVLILFAWQARAQNFPDLPEGYDTIELRETDEPGAVARLYYHNHERQQSGAVNGVRYVLGDVVVYVYIEIGGAEVNYAEIIRVEAPGYLPYPPDPVAVPDGSSTTIEIMVPLF